MKSIKRALSLILTFVMCVISVNVEAFAAEEKTETNSKINNYHFEVNYSVINSWDTSKQVQVEITNTGNDKIEQWALKYDIDGNISDIWNAHVYDAEKGIVTNAVYNADIYPGQTVSFGYIIKDNNITPDEFEMVQTRVIKEDGYEVTLHPDFYYGNHFNGTVFIENKTNEPIKNWNLEADASFEFSSVWNANVLEKSGSKYLFEGNSNTIIPAFGTVSFGFYGAFDDMTTLSNLKLTQMVITDGNSGDTPAIENPDDDSDDDSGDIDNPDDSDIDNPDDGNSNPEAGGLTWDQMQDTDGDGLPDEYENGHDLDPLNPDTDGDGLNDGFEVMKASSNPLDKYTLGNGVLDAELDPDDDGLTMLEEYQYDTNPLKADTDGDGLADGEEVKTYKTNPNEADTDGDEVNDGLEISVGLDPLNPQTFGYPDKEYKLTVSFESDSKKMNKINNGNDDYKMSISLQGTGDLNTKLYVRESVYSETLDSEFSLGIVPEILYIGDGNIEGVTVNFAISNQNIFDSYAADSLSGINRYNVFYFDENENLLVPLSTTRDESTNTISATAPGAGTFVIVDMEKWFLNLGFDVTDEYNGEINNVIDEQIFQSQLEIPVSELSRDADELAEDESDELEEDEADELAEDEVDELAEDEIDELSADGLNAEILGDELENGEIDGLDSDANAIEGADPAVDSGYVPQQEVTVPKMKMKLMAASPSKSAATASTPAPSVITPGTTTVDFVICINTEIHPLNDTEFEAVKQNVKMIGSTIFNNSKNARIYVLDQNGEIVQTNSHMDYALTELGLCDMLDKVHNTSAKVNLLNVQLNTLLDSIPFRDGAYKATMIIGSNYINTDSDKIRSNLIANEIKVIVDAPNMMPGCWYEELTRMTNGLQVFSYMEFYDTVINFMYGSSGVGLTTYNMITSAGLKKIALKSELNEHNPADTDGDGLKDWDEMDKSKVTVNTDGSVTLPTYYDTLTKTWYHEYLNWKNQYKALYDRNGRTVDEMLKAVKVLPVISDPTMKDTDGDGIDDYTEVTAKALDSRYVSLRPMKKDTVETLYPELSDESINDPDYPSYITVNNNDVVVHLKVVFEGDKDVKATSVLDTSTKDADVIAENNKIFGRIGSDPTLKELAIDGITSRWNSNFTGTEYDFCEGLPVQFSVDITETTSKWFTNKIVLELKTGVCGRSNQAGVAWNTNCNRHVTLYNNCCDIKSHKDKVNPGCSDYANTQYSVAVFAGTCAHEFGHVMGLKDLYASAPVNNGLTIVSNSEVTYLSRGYFTLPQAGCMMMRNGHGTPNDIEMLILAFCENTWQYYVPSGTTQVMSKAIKAPTVFTDGKKNFTWDKVNHVFK